MSDETTGAEETTSAPSVPAQRSYFATNKLNRAMLDDGISYVEHKLIDEGVFEEFQDLTSTVKLNQVNQSTEVDLALGKTRRFLLQKLATGWNLVDESNNPIVFSYNRLMELPPQVIAKVIDDIYEKNPVLGSTSDDEAESGKAT